MKAKSNQLREQGDRSWRFIENDVLSVGTLVRDDRIAGGGRIVYLTRGNDRVGWEHLKKHRDEFTKLDGSSLSDENFQLLIKKSVTEGHFIGYLKPNRPGANPPLIFDVEIGGNKYMTVAVIDDHGSIVTFYGGEKFRKNSGRGRPAREARMTTIKLMADYGAFPLWEVSAERAGDIDPGTLPLSEELQEKLQAWADRYDATLDMDYLERSGFQTDQEAEDFRRYGRELASQLRQELGAGYTVIYDESVPQ